MPTEIKQASGSALCEIQQKRVGELIKQGLAKGILQAQSFYNKQRFTENRNKCSVTIANVFWSFFSYTERFRNKNWDEFPAFLIAGFLEPLSLYIIPPSGDEIWNGISSFSDFQFLFELYLNETCKAPTFTQRNLVHFYFLQTWNGNGLEGHHHCATLNHFSFFMCHTSLYL